MGNGITNRVTDLAARLSKLPLWMQLVYIEDLAATADQRLALFERIQQKQAEVSR